MRDRTTHTDDRAKRRISVAFVDLWETIKMSGWKFTFYLQLFIKLRSDSFKFRSDFVNFRFDVVRLFDRTGPKFRRVTYKLF